jgi:hypothetical protein
MKQWLLSLGGLFGYSDLTNFASDIQTTVAAPTEANLEQDLTDEGIILHKRLTSLTSPQVDAIVGIQGAALQVIEHQNAQNDAVLAGTIAEDIPILDPKLGVTPEHATAFVQALSDILSDVKAIPAQAVPSPSV